VAQFYDSDLHLQAAIAEFFSHAIRHHEPAVMIAAAADLPGIRVRMGGRTHIQFVDVADALRQFMLNGMPDPVRFEHAFRSLLDTLRQSRNGGALWIFGEAVDELCRAGNHAAALRMDELWKCPLR
jgi:hypothetical protein